MNDFAEFLRKAAEETEQLTAHSSGFEEEPVSLSVFVQDKAYLYNPPLSPVQYDAVRHIERIYYNGWFRQPDDIPVYVPERDTYRLLAEQTEGPHKPGALHVGTHAVWREERYWSEGLRMINFATLQWGKGSGKDHIVRIASMRIAYLLMCLESPQDYYKMPSQDTIHLLNVASSSGQAQQAFFMPITRAVKRGWFKDRCTPKQNVISYAKNIESVSGHSDAESQEGLNLLLGIADEVDAFRSKKELAVRRGVNPREPSKSAESILEMMQSSGSTRFPEVYKQVRISYPRYRGSTIQQLTEEAKEDFKQNGIDSRHYVSGPLATWEVNPRVSGKEAFSQDYKSDPVMARSKYECKPARAVNPYFRNVALLDTCFDERAQMPVQVEYRVETVGGSPVWIPEYQFAPDFFPVRGAQYACHGDLAVAGDRAGIAMAHIARWSEHPTTAEDEDGAVWQIMESRPHVKVDFVISYTSDISAQPAREIQIRWARQLCFELIRRGFNIRRFTFDGFQCLSGDVEIPLLDGTSRKLRELEGRDPFWVYSVDNGRIVPGLCTKAWRTGHRDDMVEVELDNGETVRATSDHLFMLRDGTYRPAAELRPGDSLMPLRCRSRKVAAVRPALPEDVYDLQVEQHHNFAVGAGIFVHNSYDSMQILRTKGIESERISTDMSEDPWRTLRDLISEQRVTIPRPAPGAGTPPRFLLREELMSLTRLPNGRINHPSDGCFVGDTRIPLLDGTCPTIAELEGRTAWVYSATSDGQIVPGLARGRRTKVAKRFVDVVLDSGYVARCTPEHLWMLRDGSYKPAADLIPAVDRLMPITRTWPVNGGYERVSDKDGRRTLTHTLVAQHVLGRALAAGELAHHGNHVKTDNRPENLQVMAQGEHHALHASQRWADDAEYVLRVRAGHAAWRASDEAQEALAGRDLSKRWAHFVTSEQRHAEMARILPFYRHDITVEALRTVLHEENANAAARALGCGRNVVVSRLKQAGYTSWENFRQTCDANHKVRAVIPVELDDSVPVFDLEVDEWSNFALTGGVFVHNSKDEADALACAVLGAMSLGGQEEESGERSYFTGAEFATGTVIGLPLGGSPRKLWETTMPPPLLT
jgi:hypothetical protein